MKPFRDQPIRSKVALVVIVTSVIGLLLTSAAFATYEWLTFQNATLTTTRTVAKIIADNSTAALRFRNPAEARELLATLRADEPVVAAALYDEDGKLFASYSGPAGSLLPPSLDDSPSKGYDFTSRYLLLYQSVIQENRNVGTLFIQVSLANMQRRFLLYGGLVLLILTASSLMAFAFSASLQKRITEPIQELAKIARAVSTRRDYSMRASRYGADELGELTDAFNDMLTQIKERDERISESGERLRVALAAADMGTWRFDGSRQQMIVDENLSRLLGLPAEQTTFTTEEFLNRIAAEDRGSVRDMLTRAFREGSPFYAEYRVVRADGTTRWVRNRGKAVLDENTRELLYASGALIDVTDRKEAESEVFRLYADLERRVTQRTAELAQSNRDLEAFTYSVSHDLRAPLRHMSGYAQILKEDHGTNLSSEAMFYLDRIIHGSERLSQLIDDLLNLGKVGRQPLVMQTTDLDELVDFAIRELEPETQNRRVEWQRQPLPTVKCDAGLMRLAFVNLISNALKYSRQREPAIVAIGTVVVGSETAIFIRDNGVGFDPNYKDKLFGVFQRLHSSAVFEGTGVGLATVERIIRNHGGRIWADGQPEMGATFYFTMPGL
jgi:PAS domain S-box-containing protein